MVLKPPAAVRQGSTSSLAASDMDGNGSGSGGEAFERVINIKNCPLCQRPRLNSKAERDIVTHLAVCASQDLARMDHVMVGNFITQLSRLNASGTRMCCPRYRRGIIRSARCVGAVVYLSFSL